MKAIVIISKKFMFLSVVLFASLINNTAQANDTFKCTVHSAVKVGTEGKFVDDDLYQAVVGDVISINRETGKVAGVLHNHNSNGEPRVLDSGSDTQSFKAITIYEPYIAVAYIEIITWGHKPFIFKMNQTVLTGRCEFDL